MQPESLKIGKRLKRLLSASAREPLRMSPLVACAIAQNWEAASLLLNKGLFPCYPQVCSSLCFNRTLCKKYVDEALVEAVALIYLMLAFSGSRRGPLGGGGVVNFPTICVM